MLMLRNIITIINCQLRDNITNSDDLNTYILF